MAIKTNTTESIKNPSNVLSGKIEKTANQLKTLAARAGCAGDPMIEVEIPANGNDDVLYVGLNAVDFYFKRGDVATMPLSVAEIAANTGNLGALGKKTIARKRKEIADAAAAAEAEKAAKKAAKKTAEKTEE